MKWMPFDPREYVYPKVDILSFLNNNVGYERIFGNLGGEVTNAFAISELKGTMQYIKTIRRIYPVYQ